MLEHQLFEADCFLQRVRVLALNVFEQLDFSCLFVCQSLDVRRNDVQASHTRRAESALAGYNLEDLWRLSGRDDWPHKDRLEDANLCDVLRQLLQRFKVEAGAVGV